MPENMDVLSSLRKIANELIGLPIDQMTMNDIERHLQGTAFLIKWIADGLEREFELAAERGRRLQRPALGLGDDVNYM